MLVVNDSKNCKHSSVLLLQICHSSQSPLAHDVNESSPVLPEKCRTENINYSPIQRKRMTQIRCYDDMSAQHTGHALTRKDQWLRIRQEPEQQHTNGNNSNRLSNTGPAISVSAISGSAISVV
ncbi:hypothetical protein PoB_003133900 [Plakobranchus ocellatus]|uniref:Uncharacterized protein n=1 Tax=Plakobranchus ocellatus TaxID=259542 RepID=A0AAV4AB20_9GAST|nr:hypothetical protein PoB_003133900 [Plakobranchus ocellatus]